MPDSPLILGLDGGGTKTLLALARPDATLAGLWHTAGSNPVDQPAWRERLAALFAALPARPCAAAAGLAGYGEIPTVARALEAALDELLPCPHALANDVEMAFEAAFLDFPGVLILAGTGSMAWARPIPGAPGLRVGGWGHVIGDEGSAHWIGMAAINRLSHTLDGRLDAPAFREGMWRAMALPPNSGPAQMMEWVHGRPHARSAIAALAPGVSEMAAAGEPVSTALLAAAAEALAAHVAAARRRAGADLPWSYAGGLFASDALRAQLSARLGPPRPPALPPIGGALRRAALLAGWPVDAAWVARLAASLAAPPFPPIEVPA